MADKQLELIKELKATMDEVQGKVQTVDNRMGGLFGITRETLEVLKEAVKDSADAESHEAPQSARRAEHAMLDILGIPMLDGTVLTRLTWHIHHLHGRS